MQPVVISTKPTGFPARVVRRWRTAQRLQIAFWPDPLEEVCFIWRIAAGRNHVSSEFDSQYLRTRSICLGELSNGSSSRVGRGLEAAIHEARKRASCSGVFLTNWLQEHGGFRAGFGSVGYRVHFERKEIYPFEEEVFLPSAFKIRNLFSINSLEAGCGGTAP